MWLGQVCASFDRPIDALDIGCGTGRYFCALRNVRSLVGIDASAAMLEEARHPVNGDRITAGAIELVHGDVMSHDFAPARFDLVLRHWRAGRTHAARRARRGERGAMGQTRRPFCLHDRAPRVGLGPEDRRTLGRTADASADGWPYPPESPRSVDQPRALCGRSLDPGTTRSDLHNRVDDAPALGGAPAQPVCRAQEGGMRKAFEAPPRPGHRWIRLHRRRTSRSSWVPSVRE